MRGGRPQQNKEQSGVCFAAGVHAAAITVAVTPFVHPEPEVGG